MGKWLPLSFIFLVVACSPRQPDDQQRSGLPEAKPETRDASSIAPVEASILRLEPLTAEEALKSDIAGCGTALRDAGANGKAYVWFDNIGAGLVRFDGQLVRLTRKERATTNDTIVARYATDDGALALSQDLRLGAATGDEVSAITGTVVIEHAGQRRSMSVTGETGC